MPLSAQRDRVIGDASLYLLQSVVESRRIAAHFVWHSSSHFCLQRWDFSWCSGLVLVFRSHLTAPHTRPKHKHTKSNTHTHTSTQYHFSHMTHNAHTYTEDTTQTYTHHHQHKPKLTTAPTQSLAAHCSKHILGDIGRNKILCIFSCHFSFCSFFSLFLSFFFLNFSLLLGESAGLGLLVTLCVQVWTEPSGWRLWGSRGGRHSHKQLHP